jgi:hypothetical protein
MFDDIEFEIKEYPIQGKMVIGTYTLSMAEAIKLNNQMTGMVVKENLTQKMVNFILENKLAEFTMQESPVDITKTYRIRCFLTPDDQVRVIRKLHDVNV